MKLTKKMISMLLAIAVTAVSMPITLLAGSVKLDYTAKTSGTGNTIQVKEITLDYEKNDTLSELEIEFRHHVTWQKSAKVTSVKDNKGSSYTAYLADQDKDDCDILIADLKKGRTYTIVINGIKKSGTSGYRKLTLSVKIPSDKAASQKVKVAKVEVDIDNDDYDDYRTEIDVTFASNVTWKKNAKITSVKDDRGNSYTGYLTDIDDDECEIYIKNLKYGRTYTIKISGVKAKGASSYQTVTVTAKVPARSSKLSIKEVDYDVDYDDGSMEYTVSFEFNKDVIHKSSSYILIKDANGKSYSSKDSYIEWDDDECELYLSKELPAGKKYTYEIVNVKAIGDQKYTTLKGYFVI